MNIDIVPYDPIANETTVRLDITVDNSTRATTFTQSKEPEDL